MNGIGSSLVASNFKNSFRASKAFSTSEKKLKWEPFRSMTEWWAQVRSEVNWVDVVQPRNPETKKQSRKDPQQSDARVVFGVRCDRPPFKVTREMYEDYRKRETGNKSKQ